MATVSPIASESDNSTQPPCTTGGVRSEAQLREQELRRLRDRRKARNSATVISVSSFFVSVCGALQAPVMPYELQRRGIVSSWAAAPFIVYWTVLSIATTMLYRRALKCKVLLLTGAIITATATGLFGALQFINENTLFLIGAMLLRCFEGAGCAMYHEAAENYIRFHFDANRKLYLGANQSLYYFGFVFGPIMGGMIYERGSFSLTFGICAVCLLLCCFVLSFVTDDRCLEDSLTVTTLSYTVPFKISRFLLVLAPYIAQGFNMCTMCFLLQELGLPPIAIGVLIGLPDLTNAILNPLSKSIVSIAPLPVSILFALGTALTAFGILYLGLGSPLNNYVTQSLPQASLGLVILGVGASYLLLAPQITEARTYKNFRSVTSLVAVWSLIGSIIGAGLSILRNGLVLDSHVAYAVTAGIAAITGFSGALFFALEK